MNVVAPGVGRAFLARSPRWTFRNEGVNTAAKVWDPQAKIRKTEPPGARSDRYLEYSLVRCQYKRSVLSPHHTRCGLLSWACHRSKSPCPVLQSVGLSARRSGHTRLLSLGKQWLSSAPSHVVVGLESRFVQR